MKTTRSYTMGARAEAVEATRLGILDAVLALASERPLSDISLDDVAGRAGSSVQTVLRHFGSRSGLLEQAVPHGQATVTAERQAPTGDVGEAVRVICEHYEDRGRAVLLMLAQEDVEPVMARLVGEGRGLHRAWVEEVFAPLLPRGRRHDEAVDLLVVATDVYAWKLLRLDRGLGKRQTRQRMDTLVRSVLTGLGTTTRK